MNTPGTGSIAAEFRHTFPAVSNRRFSLNVDVTLPGQGITAVFGESGSGKTTLLRCIAGLEKVEAGHLSVGGEVWQDDSTFTPTHRRPLGYVFQESGLLPHLTARENLDYAIKRRDDSGTKEDFDHIVSLMGIENILDQYPAQLSGGERQRVAIARALLIKPRLLLMDEPLASLDTARKREIMPFLEKLREEVELPIIYVTHSVDEVARLANHIVILDQGRVTAQGSLTDVLSRIDLPIQLGEDSGVVVEAKVVERDSHWHLVRAEFNGGDLWVRDGGDALGHSIRIRILARDVSLALNDHQDSSILNRLQGEVVEVVDDSVEANVLVRLLIGETIVIARISRRSADHLNIKPGNTVWAQIKSVAILQ